MPHGEHKHGAHKHGEPSLAETASGELRRADYSAAAVRTRLAWRRTTLTGSVVVLLLLRLAVIHRDRLSVIMTAFAAFYWLLLLVIAQRRIRAMAEPVGTGPGRTPTALGGEVIGLAAGSLVFAAAGLILVLG